MNKTKIFLSISTIFILLAIGIYWSYYTFNKAVPVVEIKDSIFSTYLKNQKENFTESADWYEVKIAYPKDNQKVRDQVFEMWNNFAKENQLKGYTDAKAAREALGIDGSEIRYTFSADYKIYSSTSTISYVYEIYTYTGGAHGAMEIYPITYNDKLEYLPADKLLPNSSLEKVSRLAVVDLINQKKQRLKSFEMTDKEIDESLKDNSWLKEGTDPTAANYSRIWIDKENLVISFGQYQVGPYAEGVYEVSLPLSEI